MANVLRKAYVVDLGVMGYREAWDLQRRLVKARIEGLLDKDVFMSLEHPSVFTLGRRGGLQNLKVPETSLKSRGIEVVHVERGGDITYHGPGQLVIYPIVDLRKAGWAVVDFVGVLEEIMIQTVAEWGIQAERNSLNRGVWVGLSKIGSIGIAVRHGVTYHGLALNVNTDLEPFGWINPCGLEGVMATSMKRVLGYEIPMGDVKRAAQHHFEAGLDIQLVSLPIHEIRHVLSSLPEAVCGDPV